MGALGCATGLLAAFTFLIGMIPFLGWINWFTTLPLATISAAIAYAATRKRPDDQTARMVLAAALILIAVTIFRLSLGAGIV